MSLYLELSLNCWDGCCDKLMAMYWYCCSWPCSDLSCGLGAGRCWCCYYSWKVLVFLLFITSSPLVKTKTPHKRTWPFVLEVCSWLVIVLGDCCWFSWWLLKCSWCSSKSSYLVKIKWKLDPKRWRKKYENFISLEKLTITHQQVNHISTTFP